MAGHSKWKNIQHRKGRQDAARSKEFQKLAKEIYVAAKSGGDSLESNAGLRLAVDKAKSKSMPKDNIERAIAKATGSQNGENYDEVRYEGYGAGGVAIMVDCLTDNLNRTASSVRSTFTRRGGNLGTDGSVSYLFNRKGNIVIETANISLDIEEFELEVLEFGIEDVTVEDGILQIITEPNDFEQIKKSIDSMEVVSEYMEAEVTMLPTMEVELDEETTEKVMALIEQLEDNDDVQSVYSNLK
ncbi:YebC/PmpR family DNA-binding transcriptional regulator [Mollicutes bacterium LVI A0078]|nr:YebC/PmpR family DNA-binding transcriptional regulator [Mollicutes bacterium LVI A0075]WOO91492.1 YebC/PmpR family DNA-binding transcriptional regulator [Mollicutes bacterium LVI A0078]